MKNASTAITCSALLGLASLVAVSPVRASDLEIDCDHVHWANHHDASAARVAITTQDGKVTMLLTERDVVLQLSDRTVHRVRRQLRDKKEEQEDNWFAYAFVSAVEGTVSGLIDNSMECRLRDVRDASYENGRIVLTGRDGKDMFSKTEVCDSDVMAAFSERDARNFVREFRKVKARSY